MANTLSSGNSFGLLDAGPSGVWGSRSLDVLWERLSAAMGRGGTPLQGIVVAQPVPGARGENVL
jgi:hypothetical protein